jgi:hypothetical protein
MLFTERMRRMMHKCKRPGADRGDCWSDVVVATSRPDGWSNSQRCNAYLHLTAPPVYPACDTGTRPPQYNRAAQDRTGLTRPTPEAIRRGDNRAAGLPATSQRPSLRRRGQTRALPHQTASAAKSGHEWTASLYPQEGSEKLLIPTPDLEGGISGWRVMQDSRS